MKAASDLSEHLPFRRSSADCHVSSVRFKQGPRKFRLPDDRAKRSDPKLLMVRDGHRSGPTPGAALHDDVPSRRRTSTVSVLGEDVAHLSSGQAPELTQRRRRGRSRRPRSGSAPRSRPERRVGVRNCDHALDLRIDSGHGDEPAPQWMPGKRVSGIRFACLVDGNVLTACGAVPHRTWVRRTYISSTPVGGRGASLGRSRKAIRTDLTGGQLGRSRRSQG